MSRRGEAGSGATAGGPLRVLLLEDVPADAELVLRKLAKGGLQVEARVVATEGAFRRELDAFRPQVILADYSLPGFDGIAALELVRERSPHLPFLFVSGAIGEERAIETVKRGATDYVLKDRLERLVPSLRRALREADEHRRRRRAEEALRRSEERHRLLLEITNALVTNLDREPLMSAFARALGGIAPFERAVLSLEHPDPERRTLLAFHHDGTPRPPDAVERAMAEPARRHREELEGGGYLLASDLSAEKGTTQSDPALESLRQAGLSSYVAVDLAGQRGDLGTLAVASSMPHRYGEDGARFLLQVASQLALALDNMLAYEEIGALKARLEEEKLYLLEEVGRSREIGEILGESAVIREMLRTIETVAPTGATVLVTGETGTGKELVAQAIHRLSPRKDKPLVRVNCAALPASLIESELFGHEKGAFTGAVSRKLGRFELADSGTLFLDEIGDLPGELQAKLLRTLQEGEIERVGGTRPRKVDVRVIAATNRDLNEAVAQGRFRADLFYRLDVFPIVVPPLRERREDIPLLVRHFVAHSAHRLGREIQSVPQKALTALATYDWPGNVRELQNVVERAAILSPGPTLNLGDWAPRAPVGEAPATIRPLDEVQREHILTALEATRWRVSGPHGAARLLGLKPTTLEARMKKLGIRRRGR